MRLISLWSDMDESTSILMPSAVMLIELSISPVSLESRDSRKKWRRGLINNWNNIRKNRIDIGFLKLVFPIVVGVIGNVVLQAPVEENVITVSETKI